MIKVLLEIQKTFALIFCYAYFGMILIVLNGLAVWSKHIILGSTANYEQQNGQST